MSYQVQIKESAEKEIKKLDNSKRQEIISQLDKLEKYPKKYVKPLRGKINGLWQLRSGDFRIWYTVKNDKLVEVNAVKHKEDAKNYY